MSIHKPAFVLVHGAWRSAATWHDLVPILEDQEYLVRMLDRPGAGGHAQMPYSYADRPLDGLTSSAAQTASRSARPAALTELLVSIAAHPALVGLQTS
jgi:pimeloyl-ACP methyl ester carboxylesterase